MWLVAPLTKLAAVSLPTLAPSIGNGMTMTQWTTVLWNCPRQVWGTNKEDRHHWHQSNQAAGSYFLSDASHVAIFFNSLVMTCGSKCVCQTTTPHLWPLSSTCSKDNVFFLQLQATILIIHLFVTTQYDILHIHIPVCVLKHISPVLTPKYILSSYTKDRFQALGMGAMKGQKGSPKKARCHGVSWGRDSCKFRFPSKRSAPKLKAIDGVHFHRNDQKYRKHQPWSSFERVVAEKATSNICE